MLVAERLVDVEQDPLLAIVDRRVCEHRADDVARRAAVLEDPGPHIQRLRRDAQAFRDLLKDLCTGFLQAPLDLAEVGVGHTRVLRQLAKRDLRMFALLTDVVAQ